MSSNDVGLLQHLLNATRVSIQGLRSVWAKEPAFRYEVSVLIVALPVAWILGNGATQRAVMIGSVLLVLVIELVNSAIEAVVDRIGREPHELSKRAKDIGSAAVFASIVIAAAVWLTLLFG